MLLNIVTKKEQNSYSPLKSNKGSQFKRFG